LPVDRALLAALLEDVRERVRLLRESAPRDAESAASDRLRWEGTLRLLQTAIEGCIAVANHLILGMGLAPAADNADAFSALHRSGLLRDLALVQRLQTAARFRNLVVHGYRRIDPARVLGYLENNLGDLETCCREVVLYLNAHPQA
jgi:uncharacterized protein YutE (UPF0331/DUF86 family)